MAGRIKNQIKRFFTAAVAFVAAFCIGIAPISVMAEENYEKWPEEPEINAKAAVLIEASTGSILYEKNATDKMYPTSTTKLMTVLLAIEQKQLTDEILMTHDAIYSMGWDASRVGMEEGETLSLKDSLYAILLASANEVCYAVAQNVGGGKIDVFLEMMNNRAKELGCVNSNYVNPHGLHDDDHYTCAYDLALVMKKCIEYPAFCNISNNYYYNLPATKIGEARVIAQTHQILRRKIEYDGVFAGKTGHTDEAGSCLVTACSRDNMKLIVVVLGCDTSESCYSDTTALFDYGYNSFCLMDISDGSKEENAFPVLFEEGEGFVTKAPSKLSIRDITLVVPKNIKFGDLKTKCSLTPVKEIYSGENLIGEVAYYYDDRELGRTDIVYTSDGYVAVNPAEIYLELYGGTEEFDEVQYQILNGTYVEEEPPADLRPLIISITVSIFVLLAGIFLLTRFYIKNHR